MIPTQEIERPIRSSINRSVTFDISEDMKAHVFRILREGIYSDPMLACIREYICNAIDSNIEAGKLSSDVEVVLPNQLESYFVVRDYGIGLSEECVNKIFRFYGGSTKRESNELIGQLGLGSKAAFAYVDSFTVTARKNGVERIFICAVSRSSNGEDGKGSIFKTLEKETMESNGVEIKISVPLNDINVFNQKVLNYLRFTAKNLRPKILGISDKEISEKLVEIDPLYKGEKWIIPSRQTKLATTLVMGGVPYNINPSALVSFRENVVDENHQIISKKNEFTEAEIDLAKRGVIFYCDIGDVDVAVSREEVRYTAKTLLAIKNFLQKTLRELNELLKEKINKAKSRWEAMYLFYSFHNFSDENQILRILEKAGLAPVFHWRNNFIGSSVFYSTKLVDKSMAEGISIRRIRRYGMSRKLEDIPAHEKKPKIVIYDECKNKAQRLTEAKEQLDEFILVRANNPELIEKFLKHTELEVGEYQNLSDFKIVAYAPPISTKRGHNIFMFTEKRGAPSESWSETTLDFNELSETVTYVEIYKYFPIINGKRIEFNFLNEILSFLKEIGVPINALYGVKSKHLNKIEKNGKFIPLAEIVKTKGAEFFKKKRCYQSIVDAELNSKTLLSKLRIDADGFSKLITFLCPSHDIVLYGKECIKLDFLKDNALLRKAKQYLSIIKQLGLAEKLFDISPSVNLEEMANKILTKYPLLKMFSPRVFEENHSSFIDNNYVNGKIRIKHLAEYISLIDKNK